MSWQVLHRGCTSLKASDSTSSIISWTSSASLDPLIKNAHQWMKDHLPFELFGKQGIALTWKDSGDDELFTLRLSARTLTKRRKTRWRKLDVFDGNMESPARYEAYILWPKSKSRSSTMDDGEAKFVIIIYEKPDTANFMASLPDDMHLGEIALPGTHESAAMYGYPFSQCQQPSTPIWQQLHDGVRFFDIRIRIVGDQLLFYHGPRSQRSSLPILLNLIHSYLDDHPTETLILCLKEEIPPWHPEFSQKVYEVFEPHLSKYWFLEERIPKLGEVRGKGLIMTRFEGSGSDGWEKVGMGIHPFRWPDSRREGFDWDCNGTLVRTQDWYRVKTFLGIPEKFRALIDHITPTLQPPEHQTFTLSYATASYFPMSLPATIAKGFGMPEWGLGIEGMNSRLTRWLLERLVNGEKVRACIPMDFYREDGWAGELLVLMNQL